MAELEDLPVELRVKLVEEALKGNKRIRKDIQSIIRHREKTYYKFMLLSPEWMRLMRKHFKMQSVAKREDKKILHDIKLTSCEVLARMLKNIEFICREEKVGDSGRIELYRKNFRLFEQHWWKAKNFWNYEIPALIYRKERRLDMEGANWHFHGRFSFKRYKEQVDNPLKCDPPMSGKSMGLRLVARVDEDDDWLNWGRLHSCVM